MKRFLNLLLLALMGMLAHSVTSFAQETLKVAPQGPLTIPGVKDPVSYALGFKVGSDMAHAGLAAADFDANEVVAGFVEGLQKKGKMTDKQLNDAFMILKERIDKRMFELGKSNLERSNEFLRANKDKEGVQSTKSGLQYIVLKAGKGKTPTLTSTVKVHYEGTLLDGTVFDSSIKLGEPYVTPLTRVIPGWTEALQRMKAGDKWKLFIPPGLAYGENGFPPDIGPNELLVFELELLEVQ